MDSEEPADAVGQGKKPLRVTEGGKSKKPKAKQEESRALEPPRTKQLARPSQEQLEATKRESRTGKVARPAQQPALEPPRTRSRPSAEKPPQQADPAWGKATRPRTDAPAADVDRALSWMDSAEQRPLPEEPVRPVSGPKTAKVEAVLGWMDDLAGPFEDVVQGPRKHSKKPSAPVAERRPSDERRPSSEKVTSGEKKVASAEKPGSGEKRGRPPTGALKREAVDALLARADQVKRPTGRIEATSSAPSPFEDSSPDALAPSLVPTAPNEELGPLSASDVWLLAQTPEDVLAGARRPRIESTPPPPPPPPLPPNRAVALPPPPSPPRMQVRPATPPAPPAPPTDRRAKVEELLEWTQDLLGALESDSSLEVLAPGDVVGGSPTFTPPLDLVGGSDSSSDDHSPLPPRPPLPPIPPTPPTRSSSRLLRLQEQLRARGGLDPAPSGGWAAVPDGQALARLKRAAFETLGHLDSSEEDAIPAELVDSMEADPFGSVFPPVEEAPRDPRCKDPFCVDPRCRLGAQTHPAKTPLGLDPGSSDELRPAAWPSSGAWSRENRPRIIRPPGVA